MRYIKRFKEFILEYVRYPTDDKNYLYELDKTVNKLAHDTKRYIMDRLNLSKMEYIGSGHNGLVYDIGNNKVLKLTGYGGSEYGDAINMTIAQHKRNKVFLKSELELVNKNIEGVVKIFNVGVIKLPTKLFFKHPHLDQPYVSYIETKPGEYKRFATVFETAYIIMEKLYPLNKYEEFYIDNFLAYLPENGIDMDDWIAVEDIPDEYRDKDPFLFDRLIEIVSNIKDNGLVWRDIKSENFAKNKEGKLVAIDVQDWYDNIIDKKFVKNKY